MYYLKFKLPDTVWNKEVLMIPYHRGSFGLTSSSEEAQIVSVTEQSHKSWEPDDLALGLA